MPLSAPEERELKHTRVVVCRGYHRRDGLWDIEGHITDTKSYSFENQWRGTIHPGDPLHEMWIRLTLDDQLTVVRSEAATDASPYRVCPDIAPAFKALEGLRIGPGWMRAVKERLGGSRGCTHLVELLGPVATVAFQTVFAGKRSHAQGPRKKPALLNSCYAFAEDGENARRLWPEYFADREKT
ncbi:MAG TPA: DUF2889 domain-containing protein [Azospirillum sp.]|nr:DUF2889 domain-containing protein [Azospirillum sp.]